MFEKTGMAEERFENELKFKFFCCSLSTAFDYKLLELDIDYAVKKYSLEAIF